MSDVLTLPSTERAEGIDLPAEEGIRVIGPKRVARGKRFLIAGSFLLGDDAAEAVGSPLHRGVVLVVSSGDEYGSCTPFLETALFPDDEIQGDGHRGGFFQLDVPAHSGFRHRGTYFVHAVIGPFTSEILRIEVD